MNEMHKACVICGSENLSVRYVMNGFHVLRCGNCALLFVGERLAKEALVPYYDGDDDFIYTDFENRDNLNFYYLQLRERIVRKIPTGRILDVGCSSGYFLDVMEGWERHGIEMVASHAGDAKARYGDRIFHGTVEEYNWDKAYFDVISLQDFLDHVSDPRGTLAKCHDLLKPGGLLIVKVHDISSLYAKLCGRAYYALVPPIHLVYFGKTNLLRTIANAGFKIEGHKYFAHSMFLKTVLFRLAKNGKHNIFHWLYEQASRWPIGNLKVKKNLYDIITVFAVKQ